MVISHENGVFLHVVHRQTNSKARLETNIGKRLYGRNRVSEIAGLW